MERVPPPWRGPYLGYPISRRYNWDGFVVQAFQRGILQWRPDAGRAMLMNVFDLMRDMGKDPWLQTVRSTPPSLGNEGDAGKPWNTVVREHQALLDANTAIKQRYLAAPDPLAYYGLPMSPVVDNGSHFAIRFQRAVMQQWKIDVPWAKAGQVTIANGGDIAREAGLIPAEVAIPDIAPFGGGRVVAIDAGHGGAEIGAAYRFSDGTIILEKDLNLRVALKLADLLSRAGYTPLLTRKTDTEVNKPSKLLTRKPPIGLDDELQARIDIANSAGAKLFLSIHFNGHPDRSMRGTEIYYCRERPFSAESLRFANLLLDSATKNLALIGYRDPDPAVKYDSQALRPGEHFYLLGPANETIVRPTTMPAALAEGLFVTNATDASNLRVDRTLDVIARAYANAINDYFAPSPPAPVPAPTPSAQPTAPPTKPAPAPSPSPQPTPPQATPAPAIGQGTVVTDFGGGAVLRAEPSTGSAPIGAVPNGTVLVLVQQVEGEPVLSGDRRWYRVRFAGTEGHVYAQLVRTGNSAAATPTPTPNLPTGTVAIEYGNGALLRGSPSTAASVVRSIPNDSKVQILQMVNGEAVIAGDGRWYRVRFDTDEGFLYGQLVHTASDPPASTPVPSSLAKGTVAVEYGDGALLRSAPRTGSETVRAIPNGDQVEILQSIGGEAVIAGDSRWYRARYDGSEGYIYAALVRGP